MDTLPTLQKMEYLETGFEVSKILAQAGFRLETAAFMITWGQVAEVLAQVLADFGLPPDRFEEGFLIDLVQGAQGALRNDAILDWRGIIRQYVVSTPEIATLVMPEAEIDREDDEGPLTEQYENATRLGDDDSYWIDGGESSDFFDDF